jgi:hypothetical protein
MIYAFDVIEAQLIDLLNQEKILTAETVLQILSKEREIVCSDDLHSFYLRSGVAAEPTSPRVKNLQRDKALRRTVK